MSIQLRGCYTALVTPFTPSGSIDTEALVRLVETQIEAGISGLVPVGTTGESPTLSVKEHLAVIETVVAAAHKRVPVIAGTGSNSTVESIEMTTQAKEIGADATLQVTPYYNKPNQEGLYAHFSAIADEGGLPVVLYNIPGRSAVPIEVATIKRLQVHPNIVAIKEASGGIHNTMALMESGYNDIAILSGDDNLTLAIIAMGGTGAISVASNIVPAETHRIIQHALAGNWKEARRCHYSLLPLFRALFIDTNPIPIKCALALQHTISEQYRLPLTPLTGKKRNELINTLHDFSLL